MKKLSELVTFDEEANSLIRIVIGRIEDQILNEAKEICFKDNLSVSTKATILQVLRKLDLQKYVVLDD